MQLDFEKLVLIFGCLNKMWKLDTEANCAFMRENSESPYLRQLSLWIFFYVFHIYCTCLDSYSFRPLGYM